MTETIASLNRLAEFRDAMATGDISERIALNSAQGARLHTAATAVSYLAADNRLSATATASLGDRLLYSASHLTAACCSPNSTRLLPYYVEGMWLEGTNGAGLVARLYGACDLRQSGSLWLDARLAESKTEWGLTMQDLHYVTEDQAIWLRLLESRQYEGRSDRITIPDDVLDALEEKGLVRRWRDGEIAITLGGIREVAQH